MRQSPARHADSPDLPLHQKVSTEYKTLNKDSWQKIRRRVLGQLSLEVLAIRMCEGRQGTSYWLQSHRNFIFQSL